MTKKTKRWQSKLLSAFTISVALSYAPLLYANEDRVVGLELDALPYATGGYYFSLWVAEGQYRLRLVNAEVNIPEFATRPGFQDHSLKAQALIVDYFFDPDRTGWWLGGGYEHWRNSIKEKGSSENTEFAYHVATVGGGYIKYWTESIYINPWAALHLPLGAKSHMVDAKKYRPDVVSGEVSLKFGYQF